MKTGGAKANQMKEWEESFSHIKEGHKIIITEVFKQPIIKIDNNNAIKNIPTIQTLTEEEFVNKYASEEQKKKYESPDNKMSNLRKAILSEAGRYCDIDYNKNKKVYEIKKYYKYPVPKKMTYMKKGLYQYMIPLLLIKLKNDHDENNKIIISADNLCKKIYMHNNNYNEIKYNQNVVCSDKIKEQNLKVNEYDFGFDLDNSYDYFDKVDDMVSYYIENSLSMLKNIGVIYSNKAQMAICERSNPSDTEQKEELCYDSETNEHYIYRKKKKYYTRQATDKEKKDNLAIQQEVDRIVGLNVKQWGIKSRYYSKYSKQWNELYQEKLREYCIENNYNETIISFCEYYEVFAGLLDRCDDCLSYFEVQDADKLIEGFNQEFYNLILNNAQNRLTKNTDKYNESYLQDFANLAGITIFKDTPSVHNIITKNSEKEITVKIREY